MDLTVKIRRSLPGEIADSTGHRSSISNRIIDLQPINGGYMMHNVRNVAFLFGNLFLSLLLIACVAGAEEPMFDEAQEASKPNPPGGEMSKTLGWDCYTSQTPNATQINANYCPSNRTMINGGCNMAPGGPSDQDLTASYPSGNGWICRTSDSARKAYAYVTCCTW